MLDSQDMKNNRRTPDAQNESVTNSEREWVFKGVKLR